MSEGKNRGVMSECSNQRRRSGRLVSSPNNIQSDNKMAAVAVKRSITVRKIAPRKTVAPSEQNKENTPKRSRSRSEVDLENSGQKKKPKISTPGPTTTIQHGPFTSAEKKKKKEVVVLSPILPSTPGSSIIHGRSTRSNSNSAEKRKQKVGMPSPILPSTPGTTTQGTSSTSAKKKKLEAGMPSPILPSTPGTTCQGRGTRSTSTSAEKRKQKAGMPSPILPSTPGSSIIRGRGTRSTSTSAEKRKQKVGMPSPILPSTPGTTTHGRGTRSTSTSAEKKKKQEAVVPSTPPPASHPSQPAVVDPEDAVWTQKVRRSYSRLSDRSFNSPQNPRETMFGFEKLTTPEVIHRAGRTKTGGGLEVSGASLSGLNSFTSLLEGEDCGGSTLPELDTNIPGVAVVKEKRKRKKVQQIDSTEMEALAAKMNAEFEEAEVFELVVE